MTQMEGKLTMAQEGLVDLSSNVLGWDRNKKSGRKSLKRDDGMEERKRTGQEGKTGLPGEESNWFSQTANCQNE